MSISIQHTRVKLNRTVIWCCIIVGIVLFGFALGFSFSFSSSLGRCLFFLLLFCSWVRGCVCVCVCVCVCCRCFSFFFFNVLLRVQSYWSHDLLGNTKIRYLSCVFLNPSPPPPPHTHTPSPVPSPSALKVLSKRSMNECAKELL